MKKLDIIATIKDGIALALVNYLSIVAATALYVLTFWIPYLNVGTTIAMASLPAEMAKGNVINPLFIFEAKYRRNMGEFFILMSLMTGAIGVGYLFGIIPGIVISYAWYIAIILFVDKDRNALEALRESNKLTYGNKARIFWIEVLLAVVLCIAIAIINGLFRIGNVAWLQAVGAVLVLVLVIFFVPAMLGAQAIIYRRLTNPDEEPAQVVEQPAPVAPVAPKAEVVEPAKAKAAPKKPARKPAAKKPAAEKKPAAKKPAAKKPAAKKSAPKKEN